MYIWQYIDILRRPNKTWFSSKDNTEEKVHALTQITKEGNASFICHLTDFLKNDNKSVRETTCRTIIHLFKKIESKKGYYDTLKHCNISKSDIDYYEANFSEEQYVLLLAISSLNGNGYIREKAVRLLTKIENQVAIQFLVYRLADWVLPVRQAAEKGIEHYKSIKYIDNLIENLPAFEWLQKVERTDLSGVYQNIIEFITSTNRDYIIANFKKHPDKQRLLLAKHVSNSLSENTKELKNFLTDKLFLIRSLAIKHFDKLGQSEVDQLLNDKSSKVRLLTLYCLKEQNESDDFVKHYLADNSAIIRNFARFTLKPANINFADFYNQNLLDRKQVIGSLTGLAEVNARQYSEVTKNYLYDKKIKIRKTAFLALRRLDEESAYEYAFANLDTPFSGLRNVIIDFLSVLPRQEVLIKAREIYKTDNYELKKSMLVFFNKIGGWSVIPDLMISTIDEDEKIREVGFYYIQGWIIKAVRLFATPKPGEIERAKEILNFAYKIHEEKQYFKKNPLDGLGFYFK